MQRVPLRRGWELGHGPPARGEHERAGQGGARGLYSGYTALLPPPPPSSLSPSLPLPPSLAVTFGQLTRSFESKAPPGLVTQPLNLT
jgi:hypothetical protein